VPDDPDAAVGVRTRGLHRLVRGQADREELMLLDPFLGDLLVGHLEQDEVADVFDHVHMRRSRRTTSSGERAGRCDPRSPAQPAPSAPRSGPSRRCLAHRWP
jgi:hypothetical protein